MPGDGNPPSGFFTKMSAQPKQWLVIQATDLGDYLNQTQYAAIETQDTSSFGGDPFTDVMNDVVNRVRMKCSSSINNVSSATIGAVPPEVKTATVMLIIQGLQSRIPTLELTDDQKTLIKTAEKDLDQIVTGKLKVSLPLDPLVEVQQGAPAQVVTRSRVFANQWSMRGI